MPKPTIVSIPSKMKISFFIQGMGQLLNLNPSFHRVPTYFDRFPVKDIPHYEDPDLDALAKDWKIVGWDIFNACKTFSPK